METPLSGLAAQLKQQARNLGFGPVGIATLPGSPRIGLRTAALERWLAAGYQADMAWMADPRRRQAESLLPGARSLLAVGLNYYVAAERQPGSLKVARYGWGRDYHRVIDGRLRQLGRWLDQEVTGVRWRACVDSAPLLDKVWAEEAGLGWIGKNGISFGSNLKNNVVKIINTRHLCFKGIHRVGIDQDQMTFDASRLECFLQKET